jgi:hypothetical protein
MIGLLHHIFHIAHKNPSAKGQNQIPLYFFFNVGFNIASSSLPTPPSSPQWLNLEQQF